MWFLFKWDSDWLQNGDIEFHHHSHHVHVKLEFMLWQEETSCLCISQVLARVEIRVCHLSAKTAFAFFGGWEVHIFHHRSWIVKFSVWHFPAANHFGETGSEEHLLDRLRRFCLFGFSSFE